MNDCFRARAPPYRMRSNKIFIVHLGFCDGRRNAFYLYDRNTKNIKIDKIDSQI